MEQYRMFDGSTVSFFGRFQSLNQRSFTHCVIETKEHKFFSGIAVLSPHEEPGKFNFKMSQRLALKRACLANPEWNFEPLFNMFLSNAYVKFPAPLKYKEYWHEIRIQMRKDNEDE